MLDRKEQLSRCKSNMEGLMSIADKFLPGDIRRSDKRSVDSVSNS